MKSFPLALVGLTLMGCATSPYYDFAEQVKTDVRYQSQSNDQMVYGCRAQGDCDDRALCAACRLVKMGAKPEEITVVVQGWSNNDRRASSNHMSLEYNGQCILGYGSSAYAGPCKHWWADKNMMTLRMPLPQYLTIKKVKMECGIND